MNLITFLLIPLTVGAVSAFFSGSMSLSGLTMPPFSPPAIVFPIVWTLLYLLMGVSSWLIWRSQKKGSRKALWIYGAQLAVNFFWSILFFRFSLYFVSFLWLLLLIALIVLMIYHFFAISRKAAYLQLPYLFWCLFAAWLNLSIWLLNR